MQIGDKVKVKDPFGYTYSDIYVIIDIQDDVYFLEGIEGGFDVQYLEAV